MHELHCEHGCSLYRFVTDLIKVAKAGVEVVGIINDVKLYATKDSDYWELINRYWEGRD